jgi:DNA-binding NtrC family response regulator
MVHLNTELKKNFVGFTPGGAKLMKDYPWPGNIRELRNVVERTMILRTELEIDAADLPEELRDFKAEPQRDEPLSAYDLSPTGNQFPTLSELEDRYIRDVLNATGRNKTHAARILGMHRTSLMRRLKRLQEVG